VHTAQLFHAKLLAGSAPAQRGRFTAGLRPVYGRFGGAPLRRRFGRLRTPERLPRAGCSRGRPTLKPFARFCAFLRVFARFCAFCLRGTRCGFVAPKPLLRPAQTGRRLTTIFEPKLNLNPVSQIYGTAALKRRFCPLIVCSLAQNVQRPNCAFESFANFNNCGNVVGRLLAWTEKLPALPYPLVPANLVPANLVPANLVPALPYPLVPANLVPALPYPLVPANLVPGPLKRQPT